MKNFKLYLILIFSFFLIPISVFAFDYTSDNPLILDLTDDEFFSIKDFVSSYASSQNFSYDTIILDVRESTIDYLYFVVCNYNTGLKYDFTFKFNLSSRDIFDISLKSSGSSIQNYQQVIFWSSSSFQRYPYDISWTWFDFNIYSFGNLSQYCSTIPTEDSLFFRKFGSSDGFKDLIPPVISLVGYNDITIEINSIWNDPGFSCSDNLDTSCNVNVSSDLNVNVLGDYNITYNATDSSGNSADTVYRYVHVVDTIPPDISLIGDSVIHLSLDSEYEELGVNVSDNSNEDITPHIDSSSLDVNNAGTYYINYLACDSSDNCSSLKRVVKVQSIVPLDFSGSQYLLFDFSDIQDMFPKINFSGLNNTNEFIIVILFNIFFLIFIFIIIWIILKSVYKCISIIWG